MISNPVKNRHRIFLILALALVLALPLVYWVVKAGTQLFAEGPAALSSASVSTSADIPSPPALRPLTAQEADWARTAWAYFENNTDPQTGLVGSIDGIKTTTMWDTASYLLALISAHKLDLVSNLVFNARVKTALDSLAKMPLFDNALPNKSYSITDLRMMDHQARPTESGAGWSAIDIGRLLVPLNIIAWHYPQHTEAAREVIARWDLRRLANNGQLFSMHVVDGSRTQSAQEGRLGNEQYAAKAFNLIGLHVDEAANYRNHLEHVNVYGIQVPHDRRGADALGVPDYVLSEPYVLDGLEFGWDQRSREFAWRVFRAQEERFRATGVLTAVTEDHLDQAPHFVYNTVYGSSKTWETLTKAGEDAAAFRTLSVKAAFGWHALYRNDYTKKLVDGVAALYDFKRGWYAGQYEEGMRPNKAVTASTNAVVLESLAFIAHGRLLSYR